MQSILLTAIIQCFHLIHVSNAGETSTTRFGSQVGLPPTEKHRLSRRTFTDPLSGTLNRRRGCESPWNTSCLHLYTLQGLRRRTMPVTQPRLGKVRIADQPDRNAG